MSESIQTACAARPEQLNPLNLPILFLRNRLRLKIHLDKNRSGHDFPDS